MNKTKQISVGISAFNEEGNIGKLLESISKQKLSKDKEIKEIIVISDGSTDKTIEICKSIKNKKLRLFMGKRRAGKNKRINQLFNLFKGDIIILLDADIAFVGNNVINSMANSFDKKKNVGLVAGNVQPIEGITLPEKAFNNFVASLEYKKNRINNGENVYSARGPLMALSKEFAKKVILPRSVPDDRFLYFKCIADGYNFLFQRDAVVLFRSPQSIEEQISQGSRFRADRESLYSIFDNEFLDSEYFIPLSLQLKGVLIQILSNPLGYAIMKYIQLKMLRNEERTTPTWKVITTSKVI